MSYQQLPFVNTCFISTKGIPNYRDPFLLHIMKPYAESFYKSKEWKATRAAYVKSQRGLCERCLSKGLYVPGEIVHHKIHITPENITDPAITLSWNNLELVCRNCHSEIHTGNIKRYQVDEIGHVYAYV